MSCLGKGAKVIAYSCNASAEVRVPVLAVLYENLLTTDLAAISSMMYGHETFRIPN
jgi:hypothetical protein